MVAALAVMVIGPVIFGPRPLLTGIMAEGLGRTLSRNTGDFAMWVFSGNAQEKLTLILVAGFLLAGAAFGGWVGTKTAGLQSRSMLAAVGLFAATLGLLFRYQSMYTENYLIEISLTLVLAFLAYAFMVRGLLRRGERHSPGSLAVYTMMIGALTLGYELLMLNA